MNDEEVIWLTRLKEEMQRIEAQAAEDHARYLAEIKRLEALVRYWKWEAAKWGAPDFEYQRRLFDEQDIS